jgi:hypothetical protein
MIAWTALAFIFIWIILNMLYDYIIFRRRRRKQKMAGQLLKGWINLFNGNTTHLIPLNDTGEHQIPYRDNDQSTCPCGPECRLVQGEAGDGLLVKHRSFDGREAVEEAERFMADLAAKEKNR